MHTPRWFRKNNVVISAAPTCGINKDGASRYKVDPRTGQRSDAVDDRLLDDVRAARAGRWTETLRSIPQSYIREQRIAVPAYYNVALERATEEYVEKHYPDFRLQTIGALIDDQALTVRKGHGSPSLDKRTGDIPYIKVSDLRAGSVNINPTNMVPRDVAEAAWGRRESGLQAYDLITPERASKNIGEFCVLMPGQEEIVLTKEVLVFRPGPKAWFDSFYLLWALSLKVVRSQWNRVIFMQTNREDVGKRYRELKIPLPPDKKRGDEVSMAFREYYRKVTKARKELMQYLNRGDHHFFMGVVEDEPE